jgi:hypothetical protein
VIAVQLANGTTLIGALTFQSWGGCCGYGNSFDANPFEYVDAGADDVAPQGGACSCPRRVPQSLPLSPNLGSPPVAVASDGSCKAVLGEGEGSTRVDVYDQSAERCVIDVHLGDGRVLEGSLTFDYWGGCCGYGNSTASSAFSDLTDGR